MDVVEFFNNSTLEVSEEETVLKTSVQGLNISLRWSDLADTFELPVTGTLEEVSAYDDTTLENMYTVIRNAEDTSSPEKFHTNNCRRKHILDVYNSTGYLLSRCFDCQKGSFDQFSRRHWSMVNWSMICVTSRPFYFILFRIYLINYSNNLIIG